MKNIYNDFPAIRTEKDLQYLKKKKKAEKIHKALKKNKRKKNIEEKWE